MRKLLRATPLAGVGRVFGRCRTTAVKIARSFGVASLVAMCALSLPAPSYAQVDAIQAEAVDDYFVHFVEPGAAKYEGDIAGLPRTASTRSGVKFDASRPEVVAYRAHLAELQTQRIREIEGLLGRPLNVEFRYSLLSNSIAFRMNASEAQAVAALDTVRDVRVVQNYELDTDRGPWFIGADQIWSGGSTPSGTGYRGQGMVIGVLDTGVNTSHPSFANDAACGFSVSNPKLIAAKTCLGGTCVEGAGAVDENGHGSHTAGTSGGNTHIATGGDLQGVEISGIAPCAQLITYRVCETNTCSGTAIQAGIEAALADQVDVVNYSISGGQSPWSDADRGFLDLVDAGTLVAASAGNTSTTIPDPIGQVNHRGPWVLTVANSTHDRISKNAVSVAGGPQDVYGLKSAAAMPNDVVATVADSDDLGNALGCTAGGGFAPGSMTGQIALIRRGTCSFEEKINNAVGAGAIAVIMINNNAGPPIVMGLGTATGVPSVMVPQAEGLAISTFVVANPSAQATIDSETVVALDPIAGDVLNTGSLRGPIAGGIEVTKPDITGPGTNIMAAYAGAANSYAFLSGTSMSSPHIAGSAALVKGLRQDWTVMEVKSAIQMTAHKDGSKDFVNGTPNTGPWDADDVGNGRVDLSRAALAGLVMHETTANFLAAEGNQDNQRALNLPSARNTACTPNCTWTRTVRNTLSGASSWTVSAANISPGMTVEVTPTSFSFTGDGVPPADAIFVNGFEAGPPPTETQEITITATPTTNMTAIGFGEVVFEETGDRSPDLHITVAIQGNGGAGDPDIDVTPTSLSETGEEGGSVVTAPLVIANVGGSPLTWTEGTTANRGATVIWDQPESGTQGIVSDFSIAQDGGAYTANDFVITADTTLASIQVYGFDNSNTLAAQPEITWEIYPDAGGEPAGNPQTAPGSVLWSYSAAPTAAAVDITDNNIGLDLDAAGETVNLTPGTYWLVVFPTYTGNITAGTDPRWNWFQADVVGTGSKLIAPTLFGNITTWTLTGAGGLGTAINDTAFTLTGTGGGGVECGADWLSINPTGGTVAPAGDETVTVSMDPAGLDAGTYEANLCIDSNDPDEAQVVVPVTFEVEEGVGNDIVVFDDVNFVPNADGTGGSVRWDTAETCDCDDPPFDFNIWMSSGNMAFFWPRTGAIEEGGVGVGTTYSVLQPGDTIGPSSTFLTGLGTANTANWRQAANVDGYLGFRFTHPTTNITNYGYARITTTGTTGFPATIVSWAFNSAGDPITIPEEGGGGVTVDYGFEDVAAMFASEGWFQQNNSQPLGASTFVQGATALGPAQAGPANSFAVVNFNSTTGAGTISNWMLTPEITFDGSTSISFYTRGADSSFPDRMEVRVSSSGAGTNVGSTATDVGDFTTLLLEVNPGLSQGGYPTEWTQFTLTNADGIPTSGSGRIAFRYFVTNGGPSGSNSDIIGFDTVSITAAAVAGLPPSTEGEVESFDSAQNSAR